MAIENAKTLNVRIRNKYDSYENWASSNLVLEAGEIAICYTTVDVQVENGVAKHPALLMKVGDGENTFANLPWLSARAADVASWAKAATKPTYEANEITGIADYIAEYVEDTMGITVDTNTVYRTVKVSDYEYKLQAKASADADTAWADVADSVIVIPNDTAAIEALEGLVGTTPVAEQIATYVTNLKLGETYAALEHTHTKEEITDFAHKHEMEDVNGLADAIADAKKAGTDANAALEAYMGTNDAAVKKVADDLAAEAQTARAAEKANADAITAMKDHESVDSFADVMAEIAKKQDIIPAETYDAYGAAAQALADANEYTDGKDEAMDARVKALEEKFTGEGSVADQIEDAVTDEKERAEEIEAGLQDAIDVINNAETGILAQAKAHADGKDEAIAAAQKAGDDAMAEAQKKVASVAAGDASVTVAGTATAPTVAVKLDPAADNALKLNENGLKVEIPAAPEYSIVKAADSGDYAAVYNLTKDGAIVGASINIPKDMVVKSGSVVGDEIVLVLNDEASTEIKIPVASLIEYVTSGSQTGDMVVVNVSDDHKVTATITDGTITLAKLHVDVQTAINKAHSHENADVLAGISADDIENWNGAQAAAEATAAGALASAKSELEGKIADAQAAAEKVANDNNTAMDARVDALEADTHTHTNKEILDQIDGIRAMNWDAAFVNKHTHDNKALLDTYTQTEADLADAVAKKHEHANADVLADISAEKVAAWDKVSEKANDADLAAIAKTGSTDDLVQGELVLVFDCGTSAV